MPRRRDLSERNDHVLSLSERTVAGLKVVAGGRKWRRLAEGILDCIAPTLAQNQRHRDGDGDEEEGDDCKEA